MMHIFYSLYSFKAIYPFGFFTEYNHMIHDGVIQSVIRIPWDIISSPVDLVRDREILNDREESSEFRGPFKCEIGGDVGFGFIADLGDSIAIRFQIPYIVPLIQELQWIYIPYNLEREHLPVPVENAKKVRQALGDALFRLCTVM